MYHAPSIAKSRHDDRKELCHNIHDWRDEAERLICSGGQCGDGSLATWLVEWQETTWEPTRGWEKTTVVAVCENTLFKLDMFCNSFSAVSRLAFVLFTSRVICSTVAPCLQSNRSCEGLKRVAPWETVPFFSLSQCIRHRVQVALHKICLAGALEWLTKFTSLRPPTLQKSDRTLVSQATT